MKWIRKFLFPFAFLYGGITFIRNLLYDLGWKKSTSFTIPVIAVGNLSVGGTGKTPMIEYLIRLLATDYSLATLSRGYKRKSRGFVLANENSSVEDLGDEPFQYANKFLNIEVAVDNNRVEGVRNIIRTKPETQLVLLDDAFQHRKIKAGFYILLTSYNDLYVEDWLLPVGNLRESRAGAKRADVLIITKCSANLSSEERDEIKTKMRFHNTSMVFFTTIAYSSFLENKRETLSLSSLDREAIFAVAGIAKPQYFFEHLGVSDSQYMTFGDHHFYTQADVSKIREKANGKTIVTTEKDYVRLKNYFSETELYYLPIQTEFLEHNDLFQDKILKYVGKSIRNGNFY